MTETMTPWKRVQSLAKTKAASYAVIAEDLEVSESTINRWVQGRQDITTTELVRLCDLLDVPPTDIDPDLASLIDSRVVYMQLGYSQALADMNAFSRSAAKPR